MPTKARREAAAAKLKSVPPQPEGLGDFEGKLVEGIKIIINRTGAGLDEAMPVAPKILHQDDEGYVVLKYKTTKIRFDPRKPGKDEEEEEMGVDRIQILDATAATFVDDDLVRSAVEETQARIATYQVAQKRKRDEAKGIFTFDSAMEEQGAVEDGDEE